MGQFPVCTCNNGLGADEERICNFAMAQGHPIYLDCNVGAGHLGYGPQTDEMLQFFKENQHLF